MNKRELVERGIHKKFNDYDKWRTTKPHKLRKRRIENLSQFAGYINKLCQRESLVEDYIQKMYSQGKDIMWLYNFFLTSKSKKKFEKAKFLADLQYTKRDNINYITNTEHKSINDEWSDSKYY